MTAYSKDVIRDLVSGQLPWPQTKRIMSAYKDEDRFFKVLEVLQERVTWKKKISPAHQRPSVHRAGQEGPHHAL